MDFSEIQPYIIPILAAALAYYGGYQSYKLKVKSENINAKRNRLLQAIIKVEDFLSVLVEASHIIGDIEKKEELIHLLETNQDLYKKECSHVRSELNDIQGKIKKGLDLETNLGYSIRVKDLSEKILKIEKKVTLENLTCKQKFSELEHNEEILKDLKHRMIIDDIDSTINMIDSSGKLEQNISESISIISASGSKYYCDERVIELRKEINEIINELIDNI
jgi:hypothetical protein